MRTVANRVGEERDRLDRRLDLVRRLGGKFVRDLTAAFDRLALPCPMGCTAGGIEDGRRAGKEGAKPVDDQAFQIARRDAPAGRTLPAFPRDEGGRDIVPISCSLLDRVCRRQTLAGRVEWFWYFVFVSVAA